MGSLFQRLVLAFAIGILTVSLAAAQPPKVYKIGQGVTAPSVLKEVKPTYTAAAKKAKLQGRVQLECVVLTDGSIGDVKAVKSDHAALAEPAIKAVKQWRFKPGLKDGKPVPVQVTIEMTFTLR